jgi:hypothetical protein
MILIWLLYSYHQLRGRLGRSGMRATQVVALNQPATSEEDTINDNCRRH